MRSIRRRADFNLRAKKSFSSKKAEDKTKNLIIAECCAGNTQCAANFLLMGAHTTARIQKAYRQNPEGRPFAGRHTWRNQLVYRRKTPVCAGKIKNG